MSQLHPHYPVRVKDLSIVKSATEQHICVTHLPTGLTATSHALRSDHANRELCITVIKAGLVAMKWEPPAPPRLPKGLEELRYYVGNPSAWVAYDEALSGQIEAALEQADQHLTPMLGALRTLVGLTTTSDTYSDDVQMVLSDLRGYLHDLGVGEP